LARGFARFYEGLIKRMPIVTLLMVTNYVIFASAKIPGMLVAILTFSLAEAAVIAGLFFNAIKTVDRAQIEGALSLGFPPSGVFRFVTFPQALNFALPAYLDGFVDLVKGTAIVGFIAVQDLTLAGDIIRSRTYDAFFPLVLVAAIYVVMLTILIFVFKLIVKRLRRRRAPGVN
jgi:polar amino acid transport system substrate-binding protein